MISWLIITTQLLGIAFAQSPFSWRTCLNAHNELRQKHVDTLQLEFSTELQQDAQRYADELARLDSWKHDPRPTRVPPKRRAIPDVATTPFIHKETWDGDIYFPLSSLDLNRGRRIPVGESIHKFCCYSWPFCPKDVFEGLDFPPSADGVVQSWYREIDNYDFGRGESRNGQAINHFANVVWKETTEVGCAQSRKSPAGCIYTVARYRVQGSIGSTEDYRMNVQAPGVDESSGSSSKTILTVFMVLLVLILICVGLVILYMKRQVIHEVYASYTKRRRTRYPDYEEDDESFWARHFKKPKKNIIYKPRHHAVDGRSTRLQATDIVHPNVPSRRATLEPREPTSHEIAVAFEQPVVKARQDSVSRPRASSNRSNADAPPRPKVPPVAVVPDSPAKAEVASGRRANRPLPPRPMSLSILQPAPKPLPRKPSDISSRHRPLRETESQGDNEAVATLRAELKKLAPKPQVKPRSNTVGGAMGVDGDGASPRLPAHLVPKERSNTTTANDSKEKAMETLRTELEKLAGRSAPNTPKEVRSQNTSTPPLKPQPAKRTNSRTLPGDRQTDNAGDPPSAHVPSSRRPADDRESLVAADSPVQERLSGPADSNQADSSENADWPLLHNDNEAEASQPSVAEMRRLLADKGCR